MDVALEGYGALSRPINHERLRLFFLGSNIFLHKEAGSQKRLILPFPVGTARDFNLLNCYYGSLTS